MQQGPATAVFGGANSSGLSAAQEISAFGRAGDVTPPDTTGSIGSSQYIEIVNSEIAMYDRSTMAMVGSPVALDTFTGGTGTCDPQIKFDPQSGRWFYVALHCEQTTDQNALYVGWSKGTNPSDLSSSNWCRFTLSTNPSTSFDDYPKLGLDGSHIIIGANLYSATGSQPFQTAQILVAPKPAAGTISNCGTLPTFTIFGSPSSALTTAVGNPAFTPEPATVSDGSTATGYVIAADFDTGTGYASGTHLMLWHIGGTAAAPTLVADGDILLPSSFSVPPSAPQPGTTNTLDTMDGRLTQAVQAADPNAGGAEAIWTQHTIAGGGGSAVRWYEVIPSTMTLRQHGDISDSSGFAFNAAIAPTLNGGAVIDYNTAGPSQLVEIKAQSCAPASACTMSHTLTLGTSSATDADFSCASGPCRWGDYAGASVDPNNADAVWISNQIDGPSAGGDAQWQTDNFALTTNDTPPTSAFTMSPDPARDGSPVTLDASASTDPDGTITDYSWQCDGTPCGSGKSTSHTFTTLGQHNVTLTVTDDGGEQGMATQTITVVSSPSASFTASPNPAPAGSPIGFDGGGSSDVGGAITSYAWNFGDGNFGAGETASHAYAAAGTYTVTLTVTDGLGETSTTSHSVTVVGPPAPSFTASPNAAPIRSSITFDAGGSTDPGTNITSYSWNFGDGTTGSGRTASHAYAAAGTYTVTLTVGDSFGETTRATRSVTVVGPIDASFNASPTPSMARAPVRFDATGSTDPGTPITSYSWQFGDGTSGSGSTPSHAYKRAGTYVATLTVTDAYGATATTTRTITILALHARLKVVPRQKLASVFAHGLLVVLVSNEPAVAHPQVTTLIKSTKRHGKPDRVILVRDPPRKLSGRSQRLALRLSRSAVALLSRNPQTPLIIQITVRDRYGNRLTLKTRATLRR